MYKDKNRDSEKQRKSLEANNYQKEVRRINLSPQRGNTQHGGLRYIEVFSSQSKTTWFLGSYSIYTVYHSLGPMTVQSQM